jgi:hypothetical protein
VLSECSLIRQLGMCVVRIKFSPAARGVCCQNTVNKAARDVCCQNTVNTAARDVCCQNAV